MADRQPLSPAGKKTLAGLLGSSAAAALLLSTLTTFEGKRNVGYLDLAKIPTACMGDTKDVVVGKFYSDAECQTRLKRQALVHAAEVKRCTPRLRGNQLVAAGSLAYNIGGPAYCRSTATRRFNAGQLRAGCNAIMMWVRVGKRKVRGLAIRRAAERAICLKGLVA
jgi:lysozyme